MEKEKQSKETYRKLSTLEKQTISETTKQLFAIHYLEIGYNFTEKDINIFYYYANKIKKEHQNKLPLARDLEYCFSVVQDISHVVRLLRYEQRMLSNYILRSNIRIKDIYFKVKKMDKKNKAELQNELSNLLSLFADIEAMKQYLISVFKILKIDKTLYKDIIDTTPEKEYKKYLNYTLAEYLNDNAFFDDIYEKLEEVQAFLKRDNSKVYNELIKELHINELELAFEDNDQSIALAQLLQTTKNLNKEMLSDATKMQKELEEHNKNVSLEVFKSHLLNKNDTSLRAVSIEYLNTITDFYRKQVILRGLEYEEKTSKK